MPVLGGDDESAGIHCGAHLRIDQRDDGLATCHGQAPGGIREIVLEVNHHEGGAIVVSAHDLDGSRAIVRRWMSAS
jgi:hypothetical protein